MQPSEDPRSLLAHRRPCRSVAPPAGGSLGQCPQERLLSLRSCAKVPPAHGWRAQGGAFAFHAGLLSLNLIFRSSSEKSPLHLGKKSSLWGNLVSLLL